MIIRNSKPQAGNKYFNRKANGGYSSCVKGKPTYVCDTLANCVGYANGAFNETIGENVERYPLNCNAENFIERAIRLGLSVVKDPVVGGIMVWQKGATLNGSDGAGHVAYVYSKVDNDTVKTSESGYGCSAIFWTATRHRGSGNWGQNSSYHYRGCIVNPNYKEPVQPSQPTPSANSYIVKSGDTLSGIASEYNTTYQALAQYNNIANPNLIHVGQVINIPNGSTSTPIQYKTKTGLWLLDSNGKKIKVYPTGTIVSYLEDGYNKYGFHYYKVNCNGTIGYMARFFLQKI